MIKKITTIRYMHIFHLAVLGTILSVLRCGKFEHLSSQIMSLWILSYSLSKFFCGIINKLKIESIKIDEKYIHNCFCYLLDALKKATSGVDDTKCCVFQFS
jgi:hypothetical protein